MIRYIPSSTIHVLLVFIVAVGSLFCEGEAEGEIAHASTLCDRAQGALVSLENRMLDLEHQILQLEVNTPSANFISCFERLVQPLKQLVDHVCVEIEGTNVNPPSTPFSKTSSPINKIKRRGRTPPSTPAVRDQSDFLPTTPKTYSSPHREKRETTKSITITCSVNDIITRKPSPCNATASTSNEIGHIQLLLDVSSLHLTADNVKEFQDIVGNFSNLVRISVVLERGNWDEPLHRLLTTVVEWGGITHLSIEGSEGGTFVDNLFSKFTSLSHMNVNLHNARLELKDNAFAGIQATLHDLDLSESLLVDLNWAPISKLVALRILNLQRTGLVSIPENVFSSMGSLRDLMLQNNMIQALPCTLFKGLTSLVALYLHNNFIQLLPTGVFDGLLNLRELSLYDNMIQGISNNVFHGLTQLVELYLDANEIKTLPQGVFEGLQSLTDLWLGQNMISHVPTSVFLGLKNLSTLHLDDNEIRTLPQNVFAGLMNLNRLYLHANALQSLPNGIFHDNSNLTHLFLNNNHFNWLSQNIIGHLAGLRRLRLNHNKLQSIPIFEHLTSLQEMSVSNNVHLTVSSNQLSQLQLLSIFDASNINAFDITANIQLPSTITRLALDGTNIIGHDLQSFFQQHMNQFQHLALGWNGLNEHILPSQTICGSLINAAATLTISSTSYAFLDACETKKIDSIRFISNPQLQQVVAYHHNLVDVSHCAQLKELQYGSTDILDISGTFLPFLGRYCQVSSLFARNMLNPDFGRNGEQVLRACFEGGVNVFDVSDNPWINNVEIVERVTPKRVVLHDVAEIENEVDFFEDTDVLVTFRATVPLILLEGAPIQCGVEFELVNLMFSQRTLPAFTFNCRCSKGFRRDGYVCVSAALGKGEIAGIIIGTMLLVLLFASPFLYKWYLRRKKTEYELLEELELHGEEVEALKKGWQIDLNELELVVKVDEGAFGEVWKAQWDGVDVAVKFLKYASVGMLDQFMLNDFDKELDFLRRTRHPHLVRFFGTGIDNHGAPFLVLEFVELGSLKHVLRVRGLEKVISDCNQSVGDGNVFDGMVASVDLLKWRMVEDVAKGMAFLHGLDVMHRDLKSGNVLVTKRFVAKITDFGSMSGKLGNLPSKRSSVARKGQETTMSAVVSTSSSRQSSMQSFATSTALDREASMQDGTDEESLAIMYDPHNVTRTVAVTMTSGVGTPLYMAPEVLNLNNKLLSLKADVFSFGVLMWEVWMCKVPDLIEQELGSDFHGPLFPALASLYDQGKLLHFNDDVPSVYVDLSTLCMSYNPSSRPSFISILESIAVNNELRVRALSAVHHS
eukprot:m.127315 g.127315  ORF g.127315 m.127315 type:complete len:1307 (+) comp9443_c8_seq4:42-3962(+)